MGQSGMKKTSTNALKFLIWNHRSTIAGNMMCNFLEIGPADYWINRSRPLEVTSRPKPKIQEDRKGVCFLQH